MKLSSNQDHPDFHEVVYFIDKITVNGSILSNCYHIDTGAGEVVCATMPLKVHNDCIKTHIVTGKVDILWRSMPESDNKLLGGGSRGVFLHLKTDWEAREARRAAVQAASAENGDAR